MCRSGDFLEVRLGELLQKFPQAPSKLLGQVQRVCLWKAFVKGFFSMGLRKRDSVLTGGCEASEASLVGRGMYSLHGSSAPFFVRAGDRRDPGAENSHERSPIEVVGGIDGDIIV